MSYLEDIIRSNLDEQRRTFNWLSSKLGYSRQGLKNGLSNETIKYITLAKIAELLNLNPRIFFYKDIEIEQGTSVKIISGVDRDFLKILSNRYDSYFDKVGFYKDYYIWKIVTFINTLDVVSDTLLPVFPIKYKMGPHFLFTGEQAYQIQMILPEMELPYSKWDEGIQAVVNVTNIVQSFYFLMFMDNILNISDLMSDNLLNDTEIKKYWKIWLQSGEKQWA